MGIKVESDMLVLDNSFTKEDVEAIDEFVKINVDKERERIIALIKEMTNSIPMKQWSNTDLWYLRDDVINAIRNTSGESKEEFIIPNRNNNP